MRLPPRPAAARSGARSAAASAAPPDPRSTSPGPPIRPAPRRPAPRARHRPDAPRTARRRPGALQPPTHKPSSLLSRRISKTYNDRKAAAAALRPIYTAATVDAAARELDTFEGSTWGKKYPATVRVWRDAWERFIPFLEFPPEVRKIIYTTNSIESLNYQLRKIIKNRGHFPNDDAVIKLLWLAIRDIEDKRARERVKEAGRPKGQPRKAPPRLVEGGTVQGWNAAYGALSLAFPGRLEVTL